MFDITQFIPVNEEGVRRFQATQGVPKELAEAENLEVGFQVPDFYRQGMIVVAAADENPRFFLISQGRALEMDGTFRPLVVMNKLAGLKLTAENVVSYLEFFHAFIQEAPMIMKSDSDLSHDEEKIDSVPDAIITPARFAGMLENRFLCEACIIIDEMLWRFEFAVDHDGAVQPLDGTPLGYFGSVRH